MLTLMSVLGWSKTTPTTGGLQKAVGRPRPGASKQSSLEHFFMHCVESAVPTASAGRIWASLLERYLHPAHGGRWCYIRDKQPGATSCP